MKFKISLLISLIAISSCFTESFKLVDTLGVGCILYNKEHNFANYIPPEGFRTYDENGVHVGTLTRDSATGNIETIRYVKCHTIRTDHDYSNLIVMEKRGDLLKLRSESGAVWVSNKEIEKAAFTFLHWDELLYARRDRWIYAPYSIERTLFSKPDSSSSKVADIRGATIKIIEKGNAGWVKIRSFQGGTCGEELFDENTGWVRLISDKGIPMFWIAVDGC